MTAYIKDSIVSLATPRGVGAISVVRVSGDSLCSLFFKLTGIKKPKYRHCYYSKILSKKNTLIDRAVAVFFNSPNSFTGEDVIEISCHGGEVIYKQIINTLIFYGCREAEKGEFSKRAFLNRKMSLVEAEATNSIIKATSPFGVKKGLLGLEGKVKDSLANLKENLLSLLTVLEHELDFSEDEITHLKKTDIKNRLIDIEKRVSLLFSTSVIDKKLNSGFRVSIVGPPNAGKSSLFNSILGFNKSIVYPEKGTTRDSVEAFLEIDSLPVLLVDTAGFWKGKDSLDRLGISKTLDEIHQSDLLVVLDEKNPKKFIKSLGALNRPCIEVISKADLKKRSQKFSVSSLKNKNIDKLLTKISTCIKSTFLGESRFITTERQSILLKRFLASLAPIIKDFESLDVVVIASSIRFALEPLDEILGEAFNDAVLNNIFKNFCVGK
tara:strand:+ start:35633 stop:36946 length:1314 start_codon:yes stop_codon:yes gene_type:complete